MLKALYAFYMAARLFRQFCTAMGCNHTTMRFDSESDYNGILKQPLLKREECTRILAVKEDMDNAIRRLGRATLNKREDKFEESVVGNKIVRFVDADAEELWKEIKQHLKPEALGIDFQTACP